jgi:hypothetical protein
MALIMCTKKQGKRSANDTLLKSFRIADNSLDARGSYSVPRSTREPEKEAIWRERIDGWKTSPLSVTVYCKENNYNENTFRESVAGTA